MANSSGGSRFSSIHSAAGMASLSAVRSIRWSICLRVIFLPCDSHTLIQGQEDLVADLFVGLVVQPAFEGLGCGWGLGGSQHGNRGGTDGRLLRGEQSAGAADGLVAQAAEGPGGGRTDRLRLVLEEFPKRLGKQFGMPASGQGDVAKEIFGIVTGQPGSDGRADNGVMLAGVQRDELRKGFQADVMARVPGRGDETGGRSRA